MAILTLERALELGGDIAKITLPAEPDPDPDLMRLARLI